MDQTLPGYPTATAGAAVDPFSTAYETATQGRYENRVNRGLALARTGVENVLAPLNRGKEFREAEVIDEMARSRQDELRKERNVDYSIASDSMSKLVGQQGIGAAEAMRNYFATLGGNTPSLMAPFGIQESITKENIKGKGAQASSGMSFGAGMNLCCFIFHRELDKGSAIRYWCSIWYLGLYVRSHYVCYGI